MTRPQRIQRKRTKGWRMPPNAIYVGRGTKWGNPFRVGQPITAPIFGGVTINGVPLSRQGVVEDREHAVELFQWWLLTEAPYTEEDIRRELAGRDLACWCPPPEPGQPDHCHAALLLAIANQPRDEEVTRC